MNSITIYMAQKIINFSNANNFFFKGIAEKLPDQWEAVVMKLGYVMICWLFLYILYRKKIFLKV
jgi:predicted acyltransferase